MTDPETTAQADANADGPALKSEILGELAAWSAECSDIAREILKAGGSAEEAAGYESRAEKVDDLVGRMKTAAMAERSPRLTPDTIDVYADDLTDFPSEPTYRYEATCNLPFDSVSVGAIGGYSNESEADAAAELKDILTNLGLDPGAIRLLDGGTGEELSTTIP